MATRPRAGDIPFFKAATCALLTFLVRAGTCSAQARCAYFENNRMFAKEHFKPDTPGCAGVAECQFKSREAAEAFCDSQPSCTMVLFHRTGSDCAGWGCFTPRAGAPSENELWLRAGGGSWLKGRCTEDDGAEAPRQSGGAAREEEEEKEEAEEGRGNLATALLGLPGATAAAWLLGSPMPAGQRAPCLFFVALSLATVCCLYPHAAQWRRLLWEALQSVGAVVAGCQICAMDVSAADGHVTSSV